MFTILILLAIQCAFTAVVVFVLKKVWDRELIRAALDKLESCPDAPQIKEIRIRSASKISAALMEQIESICRKKFAAASLDIQEDPALKGGVVIILGSESLDFSLSG